MKEQTQEFASLLVNRLNTVFSDYNISNTQTDTSCEISVFFQEDLVYLIWFDEARFRILVSPDVVNVLPQEIPYTDLLDLLNVFVTTFYPVAISINLCESLVDFLSLLLASPISSWKDYLTILS